MTVPLIPLIAGLTFLAGFLFGYWCRFQDERDAEDSSCSHLYPAGELPERLRRATTVVAGDTDAL